MHSILNNKERKSDCKSLLSRLQAAWSSLHLRDFVDLEPVHVGEGSPDTKEAKNLCSKQI